MKASELRQKSPAELEKELLELRDQRDELYAIIDTHLATIAALKAQR